MQKNVLKISAIIIVLVLLVGFSYILFFPKKSDLGLTDTNKNIHDGEYLISGKKFILKNGISEESIVPGGASKVVTKYFGNDVTGDFDMDGRDDIAFLITQNTGGSGTFYYLVASLDKGSVRIGTQAMYIGDRIAPQNLNIKDRNIVVVNYAERKAGEDFSVAPSVGKTIYAKLDSKNLQFGEVVQNFEGEADVKKMNLYMKKWNWVNTIYNNDTTISPQKENKFSLTFNKDNTFSATTDCNGIGGKYVLDNDNRIVFSDMMSTMMYCEGSQESDFRKMLENTSSFMFNSKGELVLHLKFDSGSVIFK